MLYCIYLCLDYLDDNDIPLSFFDVEVDYIIVVTISCDVPTTVLIQSSAARHCSTNDPGN
jgi:hypothetical protein